MKPSARQPFLDRRSFISAGYSRFGLAIATKLLNANVKSAVPDIFFSWQLPATLASFVCNTTLAQINTPKHIYDGSLLPAGDSELKTLSQPKEIYVNPVMLRPTHQPF